MPKSQITIPVYIPHIGCTHRCAFCNQRAITGTTPEIKSSMIVNLVDKYLGGVSKDISRIEIGFFGGSFTGMERSLQKELLDTANHYLKKMLIDGIRISTRPDYINGETLDFLMENGVSTVELGIQSLSDRVLTASNRGHTAEDSYNAISLIKASGMRLVLQIMPGLPEDTEETSMFTAYKTAGMGPDSVRIYPAVIFKDTDLEKLYRKNLYTPMSLERAIYLCSNIYRVYKERDIPVIRMGLHPLKKNELGGIIAGPYHPSFGFLVKSRIKRDILERELWGYMADNRPGILKNLSMQIPHSGAEEFIGNRKENINYLKKMFKLEILDYRIVNSDKCGVKIFEV